MPAIRTPTHSKAGSVPPAPSTATTRTPTHSKASSVPPAPSTATTTTSRYTSTKTPLPTDCLIAKAQAKVLPLLFGRSELRIKQSRNRFGVHWQPQLQAHSKSNSSLLQRYLVEEPQNAGTVYARMHRAPALDGLDRRDGRMHRGVLADIDDLGL